MPNFFTENKGLQFHFDQLDLEEVVGILEHNYSNADKYDLAPTNYQEAMEIYRASLDMVGDLTANFIAPRAMDVDREGAKLADGKVTYAKGMRESLDKLAEAGLMGVIVPHKYGGINFPATIYMMMIEMVSRADASLMTLFGYQDVGEAIAKFGSEEVANDFLPKYAAGEWTGAMVLTEPAAGSDLQSVQLKAHQDEDGNWFLKGNKHFISNGCGDVLLVLARSEPNTNNMFGLSLFAVHGGEKVQVNHIEEKLGLHGSPTCQLHFDDAPASLVGRRRHGLLNVLYVLNHARFSVAAQGLGIAEAAYEEALKYAKVREQFGKLIYDMPPVANMLMDMRVSLDACRSMVYNGAQWLDKRNKLEEQMEEYKKEGKPFDEVKQRFNAAAKIVDLLSPMVKYVTTETAYKVCYDAQQVHGGMGYMKEMPVERLIRDVRITTIYEGTSQVQVGASAKGAMNDVLSDLFDEYASQEYSSEEGVLANLLQGMRSQLTSGIEKLNDHSDPKFKEVVSKEVVDTYASIYAGYLLLSEVKGDERRLKIATRYIKDANVEAQKNLAAVENALYDDLDGRDVVLA